jgi:hypothetical protein
MTTTIQHKRGDTLEIECTESADGTPVNLTGYTVEAQVRTRGGDELVDDATVTLADQGTSPGVYTVSVAAARTALWEPGRPLDLDVQYTAPGGTVWSSGTISITVIRDITR